MLQIIQARLRCIGVRYGVQSKLLSFYFGTVHGSMLLICMAIRFVSIFLFYLNGLSYRFSPISVRTFYELGFTLYIDDGFSWL